MKEVVYIAELDADIDDIIAAEYLNNKGNLRCVVLDPIPKTTEGKLRVQYLKDKGIEVLTKMPNKCEYVFIGGALYLVSSYILTHKIDALVMNGGFVGDNLMKKPLDKFKGKKTIRTFNFNCDVTAADNVLKSKNIDNIFLIGKNVCHNEVNTFEEIWKNETQLIKSYKVKSFKRMHDLLACREGLIKCGLLNEPSYLEYDTVYPFNDGLKGDMTTWGSLKLTAENKKKTPYREVIAAIDWR